MVQHGPYDVSDGGALDTAWGVACLDQWLVTQAQVAVKWDVIAFNWGLHDRSNSSKCEDVYRAQLANITTRLLATGAKLLYATTTPYMPMRLENNFVIEDMNRVAREIMASHNIPVVDL